MDVDARDKNQEMPLHCASQNWTLGAAEVLLEYGANVNAENAQGWTPLHVASAQLSFNGSGVTFVHILLKQGTDVNARDRDQATPLHFASCGLESVIAQVLVENGAQVNAVNTQGWNALHLMLAQDNAKVKIAELLMSWGVDINARVTEERTPLHLAAYYGYVEIAELLLDHGTRVDVEDIWGQTPLHCVLLGTHHSQSSHPQGYFLTEYLGQFVLLALRLLEHCADMNAQNKDHETPLHLASRLRLLEMAQLLLQLGADVNVKNAEGKAPLQVATRRKGKAMRRLLLGYFAGQV